MGKEQLEASIIIATTRKEKCQCLLNKHHATNVYSYLESLNYENSSDT